MNRRGFLGSLLAAPIAAVMGWKSKGPIGLWGRETFKRVRGGGWKSVKSPEILITHPEQQEQVRKILSNSKEAGSAYNFLKSREASEIMAKADREFLARKR